MRSEGIVLSSKPLGERAKLIRLFTYQEGIVGGVVRGLSRKESHRLAWTTPLARCEYIWHKRGNDLLQISDATLLYGHWHLGERVIAAGEMLKVIGKTQVAKAAPLIYRLLVMLLEVLPEAHDPRGVAAIFALKVLQHEGMLSLQDRCCGYGYVEQGQLRCPCKGRNGIWLSLEEVRFLQISLANKSLDLIKEMKMEEKLAEKTKEIVREQIE